MLLHNTRGCPLWKECSSCCRADVGTCAVEFCRRLQKWTPGLPQMTCQGIKLEQASNPDSRDSPAHTLCHRNAATQQRGKSGQHCARLATCRAQDTAERRKVVHETVDLGSSQVPVLTGHFPSLSLSFSICKMMVLNQRITQIFSNSQKLQSTSQIELRFPAVTDKPKILMAYNKALFSHSTPCPSWVLWGLLCAITSLKDQGCWHSHEQSALGQEWVIDNWPELVTCPCFTAGT